MDSLTKFFQTVSQFAIIDATWGVSDLIVRLTHLSISSDVSGLFLTLTLSELGIIRSDMVNRGAKWALGELVFFFIPITVSIL